jgi:uncharacterized membrane protein
LLGGGDFNGGVMMYRATGSVLQAVGTCLVVVVVGILIMIVFIPSAEVMN